MANYHCTINPPSASISAKNHAAYIERDGKYETRKDFERSESGNMPKWAEHDSSLFWEAADRFERANGRTYREIEVSLPRELSEAQRVELVRDFVGQVLGDKHPYTWAIHNPPARDGGEQPHAHIMFSERINDGRDPELFFKRVNHQYPEKGGAGKNRYFNSKEFVLHTRELWARVQNQHLEKAGLTLRVDHRSYKEQGAGLEPTRKLGRADYLEKQGQATEIGSANREIMRRNGDRIIAAPGIAIENLTRHQSTFTKRDLERYLMRNTDGADQFQVASLRVLGSPSIIALQDGKEMRYSSRELYEAEGRVLRRSEALGRSESAAPPASAIAQASHGRSFNADQAAAFAVLTGRQQLAAVNGSAGTGKSYMLSAVREGAGLSAAGAGLLTTLPVLCLGLFAPLAPKLARRIGAEQTILAVLLVLMAALLLRPLSGVAGLFLGTVLAGACIGIGNVLLPAIVKRDDRRTDYDRAKLKASMMLALRKRRVSAEAVESAIERIEAKLRQSGEKEVASTQLGEWVMRELRRLDKVAYIRFASVYRSFDDVSEFVAAINETNPRKRGG